MTTKTYIVPAFLLVDADTIEQADELACELADTLNARRNLAPGTRLRLDEGKATIEAPEDFPGESLLQLDEDEEPAADSIDVLAALRRILAGLQEVHEDTQFGLGYEIELAQDAIAKLEGSAA